MWHEWIEAIATAIGGLATAVLAYLTYRTLIVLRDYAADTKQLAKTSIDQLESSQKQLEASHKQLEASREQLESSQTPFLALVEIQTENPASKNYRLANQGSGPAVNVEGTITWWTERDGSKIERQCIGAGESVGIGYDKKGIGTAQIDYESLSGKKYQTLIQMGGYTRFIRINKK